MKASDLMIGDWVHISTNGYDRGNYKVTPYIIYNLLMIKESESPQRVILGIPPLVDLIVEPIPLTPEILEKNGYICKQSLDKEIISHNWGSPDRRVTLNDTNGSPWFCIIRSEGMMEQVMIGMAYVHELQHALKLCGIEKEIVL